MKQKQVEDQYEEFKSHLHLKKTKQKNFWAGGMAQAIEHLPDKHKALSSLLPWPQNKEAKTLCCCVLVNVCLQVGTPLLEPYTPQTL
jgi:hypothetical protein